MLGVSDEEHDFKWRLHNYWFGCDGLLDSSMSTSHISRLRYPDL